MRYTSQILRCSLVGLFVVVLCAAAPVGAAPGDLDPSFAGDGILENAEGSFEAVVIQDDDKIVGTSGFGLVRYESNGTLDQGFGTSGHVGVDFGVGTGAVASAAVIAPDGSIVVAGTQWPAIAAPAVSQLAIARFDVSGVLDPTFGTAGTTLTDIPVDLRDVAETMVRLPSGRLVLGGSAAFTGGTHGVLVAYDDSGALDPGFGTGGIVLTTEPSAITAIAVRTDEIVAVGSTSTGRLALARFAFDGTPGAVTVLPDPDYFATDLAVDPIGRIVVAGGTGFCGDSLVARFLADGSLDPDFGTGGVVVLDVSPTEGCGDFARALALPPDGKILVVAAGITFDAPPSPVTLSTEWLFRLDPDGALDVGFGDAGAVLVQDAAPTAMALQRDGRVVTGGYVESLVVDPPFIGSARAPFLARSEAAAALVCTAAPRNDCGTPSAPQASALKLSRRSGKAPTLHWSWKKGSVMASNLGDPTSAGSYALCFYDGGNALVGTAQVEGGGLCAGKPCWKTTGTSGWQYKNSRGTVFGVDKVKLRVGSGKAAIDLQGKHPNLPVLPLPLPLPLRVQLQTSLGTCFGADYPMATRNDATDFSAKN